MFKLLGETEEQKDCKDDRFLSVITCCSLTTRVKAKYKRSQATRRDIRTSRLQGRSFSVCNHTYQGEIQRFSSYQERHKNTKAEGAIVFCHNLLQINYTYQCETNVLKLLGERDRQTDKDRKRQRERR